MKHDQKTPNRNNKTDSFVGILYGIAMKLINNPLVLLTYFLYTHVLVASAFNRKTVENVLNYLIINKSIITWEINDSGFVRVRFPNELIDINQTGFIQEDLGKLSLRSNYWFHQQSMGAVDFADKAAHDHPNGFISYVLNNGYSHEVFSVVSQNNSATQCELSSVESSNHTFCTLHSIFSKRTKTLSFEGIAELKKERHEHVKAHDTVFFDDKTIHRIANFKPNTLTLNLVRSDGDSMTNIYISPLTPREASATRSVITEAEAGIITDHAIGIYQHALEDLQPSDSSNEEPAVLACR